MSLREQSQVERILRPPDRLRKSRANPEENRPMARLQHLELSALVLAATVHDPQPGMALSAAALERERWCCVRSG
jgi:hypothetical protein